MNSTLRSFVFWMVLVVVVVLIWNFSTRFQAGDNAMPFSEFIRQVDSGQVDSVTLTGNEVTGTTATGETFRTFAPPQYEGLVNKLVERDVAVTATEAAGSPWATLLYTWAPMLLIIAFWVFFMRQVQTGGNKALSFGKSRAKLSSNSQKKVTFKDVAGVEEPKEELQEIIEFLKEPQKFQKLGGRIPKGVLLMGSPAPARRSWRGPSPARPTSPSSRSAVPTSWRCSSGSGPPASATCSSRGRRTRPASSSSTRSTRWGAIAARGSAAATTSCEQTLNQLLVEMDGFESNEGVILVAATNRPDVLDPALLRPGRFDRRIVVNRPDVKGREGILGVHTRKIPLSENVRRARACAGHIGLFGRRPREPRQRGRPQRRPLQPEERADAGLRVRQGQGPDGLGAALDDHQRRGEAGHRRPRGGHALLTVLLPHADPIHKVTIIPRGMALGVTQQLPVDDKHNYSRDYLDDQIAILLGGRIAEELTNGNVTTGAGNDLDRATDMARRMVCEWGMSDEIGPLTFGKKEEQIFLGRDFTQHQDYSEGTAIRIDQEIKRIVTGNYERARTTLEAHASELNHIAEELLIREVLDADQVRRIAKGLPIEEPVPARGPSAPPDGTVSKSEPENDAAPLVPPVPSLDKAVRRSRSLRRRTARTPGWAPSGALRRRTVGQALRFTVERRPVTGRTGRRRISLECRTRTRRVGRARPQAFRSYPSRLRRAARRTAARSMIAPRRRHTLSLPDGRILELGARTLLMGIVNVTPDSFADGGACLDPARAVDAAMALEAAGADHARRRRRVDSSGRRPAARRCRVRARPARAGRSCRADPRAGLDRHLQGRRGAPGARPRGRRSSTTSPPCGMIPPSHAWRRLPVRRSC